jgi:hypothetical protein
MLLAIIAAIALLLGSPIQPLNVHSGPHAHSGNVHSGPFSSHGP